MKFEFPRKIFEKYSNIKFYENPTSESRVVPCRHRDGRTEMTKLVVAHRNFANTPKSEKKWVSMVTSRTYCKWNWML